MLEYFYTEKRGQYRRPHNHGDAWVVYTVESGVMEMGTYELKQGVPVLLEMVRLTSGESKTYLKGEIHDTRCLSEVATIKRITSLDLAVEEKEGRMQRFDLVPSTSEIAR
jgi:hypothetical protein